MILQAIRHELNEALLQDRQVEQIKVSHNGLPGTIAGVPMNVGGDTIEIVVHPDDFADLLMGEGIQYDLLTRTTSILGLPIFYDAKTPLDMVANAITKLTDGSLTFGVAQEDDHVVAGFQLDGHYYAYRWSLEELDDQVRGPGRAEAGVRELLSLPNLPSED